MSVKEAEMTYIGKMIINSKHYEVFEDGANNIINIFYKNIKKGDIECWSIKSENVLQTRGKDILTKIQSHWSELFKSSTNKLDPEVISLQTFPWDFWADVIVPIKNGQQSDFHCELLTGQEATAEMGGR